MNTFHVLLGLLEMPPTAAIRPLYWNYEVLFQLISQAIFQVINWFV
jgi:hypothetical protein